MKQYSPAVLHPATHTGWQLGGGLVKTIKTASMIAGSMQDHVGRDRNYVAISVMIPTDEIVMAQVGTRWSRIKARWRLATMRYE